MGIIDSERSRSALAAARRAYTRYVLPVVPRLRRWLRALVRPDDVDDVLQATLLRALDAWLRAAAGDTAVRAPRDGVGVGSWLCAIARNVCGLTWRRAQRRAQLATDAQIAEAAHAALTAEQSGHHLAGEGRALREALASLAPEHRAVLLHHAAGESYAEIAIALGLPAGTVASRINRARAAVRAILAAPVPA